MAELPQLSFEQTTDPKDFVSALLLIANSIAQQRQTVNNTITLHPYFLAPLIALCSVIIKVNYKGRTGDVPTVGILLAGATIAILSIMSKYTAPYLNEAEKVGCDDGYKKMFEEGKKDVFVAKWGQNVIAVAVLDVSDKEEAKVIAWTTTLKYRGKGVGKGVLETAVEAEKKKGFKNVVWSEDNVHSFRCSDLPKVFNNRLDRGEERTKKLLVELCKKE
ncbi:hypothetical protein BZA77DRAFT_289449 [Pyronema omphalodes]|nr:hypothetical protein BZA77DRAFT_289449 [Pyronema omphalodes]